MNLEEMLKEYATTRRALEDDDAALEERKKQLKETEKAILTHFENEGVSSVKVAGLGSFARRSTSRCSLIAETKADAIATLKEFAPDIVQETVNANTLSGWYREAKKTGQDISKVEPFISVYEDKGLSWTRGA